jgi:hypothetical protein
MDEERLGGGGTASFIPSVLRTLRPSEVWTGADDGHASERWPSSLDSALGGDMRGELLSIGDDGDAGGDPPLLRTSSDDAPADEIPADSDREALSCGGPTATPPPPPLPCCCSC